MKKLIYLIVAIVILGLIVSGCLPVVPPSEQSNIDNLTKGTILYVPTPYATIQDAIDAAALSGDTINVADGIYIITSRILVNKEVTITGNTSSPENVVVQYASSSQTLDCFDMQANDITVQGIKVVNGRYGFNFAVTDPTGCTISNCVIDQCYEGAINIDGGSGHTISNNTITSCLTSGTKRGAIHIYGCPDVTIDGNTLTGNGLTGYHATMGIYVKFTYPSSSSERVEVINNNISGMLGINADIQIYNAPYTYIYNNIISNSEDKGIAIFGIYGNPAYTSADNRVQVIGNTISSTYFPGVQACNAPYTYFYNNTLTKCNYYGSDGTGDFDYASIHIDSGSANCLIASNTVSDGINGIQLWSDDCTVTNNEIYDMGLTYANTKTTSDGTYYNSAILYGDMYDVNMPTSATISNNNIHDNYWGLFVIDAYTGTVTAECNWWGDDSGPTHSSNPLGTGDNVSDNVDFDPWIGITELSGPTDPVKLGDPASIYLSFTCNKGTATLDWGDGTPVISYSSESETTTESHTYSESGVYTVTLTIEDCCDRSYSREFRYVVVYDPTAGFVTGGGWINSPAGAYASNLSLTGKANFGFVSKYKKGQTTPTGNTEFQFKAGDLNFHSDSYDWLVIAGHKAMYKGTGTINGAGNYGFMLSAIDENLTPSTDVDMFRIKIWDKGTDNVIYDNQSGENDDADPTTEIGGGQIVIHKGK